MENGESGRQREKERQRKLKIPHVVSNGAHDKKARFGFINGFSQRIHDALSVSSFGRCHRHLFRNAVKIFFDRLKNLCGCECARGTMEELEDREANVCTPTDLIAARLRAARATVHRACLSNKTLKTRASGAVRCADKIDSSSATRYNETCVSRLFLFFTVFDGSRFNSRGKNPASCIMKRTASRKVWRGFFSFFSLFLFFFFISFSPNESGTRRLNR